VLAVVSDLLCACFREAGNCHAQGERSPAAPTGLQLLSSKLATAAAFEQAGASKLGQPDNAEHTDAQILRRYKNQPRPLAAPIS